jgi:hypothetical protein
MVYIVQMYQHRGHLWNHSRSTIFSMQLIDQDLSVDNGLTVDYIAEYKDIVLQCYRLPQSVRLSL